MKINLNEIPEAGRDYHFDQITGELNAGLADLIGSRAHSVDFHIRPIGNAFEVTGTVKTQVQDVCSKCGWDIDVGLFKKINEILIHNEGNPRKYQNKHGNGSVEFNEDGPSVTTVKNDNFLVTDFIHEAIALAIPMYPSCGDMKCPNLDEVLKKQESLEREFALAGEKTGHPAFSVLKKLKN